MDLEQLQLGDWVFIISMALNVILLAIIGFRTVFIKKYSLGYFGINNVQRVGALLSSEWRESVWGKGYMTRWEWYQAQKLANITDSGKAKK